MAYVKVQVPAPLWRSVAGVSENEFENLRIDVKSLFAKGVARQKVIALMVETGWDPEFASWYALVHEHHEGWLKLQRGERPKAESAPKSKKVRKPANSLRNVMLAGWAGMVLMVLMPPIASQSSTYGHLSPRGFAPIFSDSEYVINYSQLWIQLLVWGLGLAGYAWIWRPQLRQGESDNESGARPRLGNGDQDAAE